MVLLHSTSRTLRQGYRLCVLVSPGNLSMVACDGSSRQVQRDAEEGQARVVRDVGVDTHCALVTRMSRSSVERLQRSSDTVGRDWTQQTYGPATIY